MFPFFRTSYRHCADCHSSLCDRRRFFLPNKDKDLSSLYRYRIGGYFVENRDDSTKMGKYACDQITDDKHLFMRPVHINNKEDLDKVTDTIKRKSIHPGYIFIFEVVSGLLWLTVAKFSVWYVFY